MPWLVALLIWPAITLAAAAAETACVVDGDTLRLGGGMVRGVCEGGIRVRLHGVDAPELNPPEPGGAEAADMLRKLIGAAVVECFHLDVDRHARSVAMCSVGGRDLGAMMIASGRALACPRFTRQYDAIEADAARRRLGLWADGGYRRKPYCIA